MPEPKYLLVKGAAGLGNRIFSLLNAILYARLTRRQLIVDWRDGSYSSDGSNAVHHFYRSSLFHPADEIPNVESVEPALWRGHLHERALSLAEAHAPNLGDDPFLWKRFSVDLSRIDYGQDLLVMWGYFPLIDQMRVHFRGEFRHLRGLATDAILRELMSEHLELQPAIQERIGSIRRVWPANPALGVHVRYTDKKTRVRAILHQVDQLRSQHPGMQVFLATDSRAIEQSFAHSIPGLLTAPKWYPGDGQKLHESMECPDKTVNGIEALTDLYLLAGCDHLVLDTHSSLSRLAGIVAHERARIHDIRGDVVPQRLRHLAWATRETIRWGPRRFLAGLRK